MPKEDLTTKYGFKIRTIASIICMIAITFAVNILDYSFWISLILLYLAYFSGGILGTISTTYIWIHALIIIVTGTQTIYSALFYMSFAVWLLFFVIPGIIALIYDNIYS